MPDSERELLGALLDRLHSREVSSPILPGVEAVPLADLVNLLRLLGEVGTGRPPADAHACALEVDDLGHLMASGAEAIARLPGSFERLLDRLAGEGDQAGRGWTDVYGLPLVRWMRSERPFIDVMRPIFEQHGLGRSLPARRSDADPPTRGAIDKERKRQFLTLEQMERLQRSTEWDGPSPARRDEVLAVLRPKGLLLPAGEAASHLGVPWRCFRSLRDAGAISPCWEHDGCLFYYKTELDRLIAECGRGVGVYRTSPPAMSDVNQFARTRLLPLSEVLVDMLRGDLTCDGVLAGEATSLRCCSGPTARIGPFGATLTAPCLAVP